MKVPYGDQGLYILDTASWRAYRPEIDKDLCVNCGICLSYCPVNSFYKQDKEIILSLEYCKGCGICKQECPKQAIKWLKEEK